MYRSPVEAASLHRSRHMWGGEPTQTVLQHFRSPKHLSLPISPLLDIQTLKFVVAFRLYRESWRKFFRRGAKIDCVGTGRGGARNCATHGRHRGAPTPGRRGVGSSTWRRIEVSGTPLLTAASPRVRAQGGRKAAQEGGESTSLVTRAGTFRMSRFAPSRPAGKFPRARSLVGELLGGRLRLARRKARARRAIEARAVAPIVTATRRLAIGRGCGFAPAIDPPTIDRTTRVARRLV